MALQLHLQPLQRFLQALCRSCVGTKYRVGKVFGTFNTTDRFRTTASPADVNQIEGTYFDTIEEESPWQAGAAYAQGDRVYNQKRIYEAQGAGTSGTIPPVHTDGVVSDGVINWAFIDDAGKFDIDLTQHPYPRPQYIGNDMPEWLPHRLYAVGQKVWYRLNVYEVAPSGGGVTATTPPTHTTGDVSDGQVTWSHIATSEAISLKTRLMGYDQGNNYSIEILEVHPGSNFIPNDVVSVNTNNITLAEDEKSVEISGFASVKKIRVTARLEKDIIMTGSVRTDKVYFTLILLTSIKQTIFSLPKDSKVINSTDLSSLMMLSDLESLHLALEQQQFLILPLSIMVSRM